MLTHLHTSLLPLDQFRADLQTVCGSFQVQPTSQRAMLRGAVALEKRGEFEFAHVAKDVHAIRRDRGNIARDGAEHFFLIIQEEGQALMNQNEVTRTLRPGDLMLIDSREPSEFSFFGGYSRQLSLHLPRRELQNRFGNALRGGIFVPRADHTALALFAVLSKAFEPDNNVTQTAYLGEAMFGLLGSILYANGTPSRCIDADVGHAHILERAMSYVDAHYTHGDFTIQQMASALKVSTRQLQRAFLPLEMTPTEYLLQKRLAYACQALKQKHAARENTLISSIAFQAGFNDLSYFNRIFKNAFNCTPSAYGETLGN